jgi:hypothetical protein
MADCVETALERLAAADATVGGRLSSDDLAELYVSEDQRKVHDAVTRRFIGGVLREPGRSSPGARTPEGTGT